jgi:dTDP-4-amino-4,6-dideoxygalactose transaminase
MINGADNQRRRQSEEHGKLKGMRTDFLPFSPPQIDEDEIDAVVDALRSGWLTTGPRTQKFADEFKDYIEAPAALAINSCTAALHIALAAWGVGEGDLVFTTPMTFTSTVHVVEHLGATPVLVDVEPDTLNIDPAKLDAEVRAAFARGQRPKVLLPVHFTGHPADLDPILETAAEHGLNVLEDAAHSLPAAYKGRMIGDVAHPSVPRAVAFSFYATKNLTTTEGGMLTGRQAFIDEAKLWSLHGMGRDAWKRYGKGGAWHYEVTRPGFKYNMTDLEAAIGSVQLAKLPKFDALRHDIARRYTEAFSEFPELRPPTSRPEVVHAWHLYTLRLQLDRLTIGRDQFIEELAARNIGTSVHFIPIHHHQFYREKYGYDAEQFPVATAAFRSEVSLPIYPSMTDRDVIDVIEAVRDIAVTHRS